MLRYIINGFTNEIRKCIDWNVRNISPLGCWYAVEAINSKPDRTSTSK